MNDKPAFPDIFFADSDREILSSLQRDPSAQVNYDPMYSFVFWDDERPLRIDYELRNVTNLQTLQNYRTKLWFYPQLGCIPEFSPFEVALWDWTRQHVPDWLGFSRQQLTAAELQTVKEKMARARTEEF